MYNKWVGVWVDVSPKAYRLCCGIFDKGGKKVVDNVCTENVTKSQFSERDSSNVLSDVKTVTPGGKRFHED